MAFSVETCRRMIKEHENALVAVLKGQSYSINGRAVNRADLSKIQAGLETWNHHLTDALNAMGGNGGKIKNARVIFHG